MPKLLLVAAAAVLGSGCVFTLGSSGGSRSGGYSSTRPAYNSGYDARPSGSSTVKPTKKSPKRTEAPKAAPPKRTKPAAAAPKRTVPSTPPKRTEPKRTEPKRTEPKRTEPKGKEPQRTKPQRTKPQRDPSLIKAKRKTGTKPSFVPDRNTPKKS